MAFAENHSVVIVAVDRSKQSEEAFNYYADNLHKVDDTVILIHVPEHPTVTTSAGIKVPHAELKKMHEREKKETEKLMEKYTNLLRAKGITKHEYVTKYGHPGQAIVEAAEAFSATYVVVGTRGMGLLRRTIMGSISDYLLHHINAPIFVYRH